ncbi:hypothetical protein L1987_40328 [Smallanthus sonchifolius]|uniref:Uncharacterized protein n=1 Tax=Smallanthus sonchifolius TaxID=185202 RepID=A0ACB9GSQ1_9ASTR|nr:hypothetical protein L1987_40328 [Smallanthus sonchifolius]
MGVAQSLLLVQVFAALETLQLCNNSAVGIPAEHLVANSVIKGTFPIINASGQPCKPGALFTCRKRRQEQIPFKLFGLQYFCMYLLLLIVVSEERSDKTVAAFFSHVMSAIGENNAGPEDFAQELSSRTNGTASTIYILDSDGDAVDADARQTKNWFSLASAHRICGNNFNLETYGLYEREQNLEHAIAYYDKAADKYMIWFGKQSFPYDVLALD